jgi:hypothetical protein
MTTKLLDSVFQKAAGLPLEKQDMLARQWLDKLEEECRWNEGFAKSQDKLDIRAEHARREHAQGRTISRGWDEL